MGGASADIRLACLVLPADNRLVLQALRMRGPRNGPRTPPVRGHSSRARFWGSWTWLSLEAGGDPRGDGPGGQGAAGALGLRHPRAHLESGRAVPAADEYLVLDAERLLAHLAHRRRDPHQVTVAHRRGEARPRLHDGHPHDALGREQLAPRQAERL